MNKMTIRNWYSSKVSIPNFQSKSQLKLSFLKNNLGMLHNMLGNGSAVRFFLTGQKEISTAAVDIESKKVYLQVNNFSHISEDRLNPNADACTAFGAGMGMVAHEFSHLLYESFHKPDFVNELKVCVSNKFYPQLAGNIFNILEDIRIEWKFKKDYPVLEWTLDEANYYLFGEKAESFKTEIDSTTSQPEKKEDISKFLNYLLIYKSQIFELSDSAIAQKLHSFADRFSKADKLDEQLKVCSELYDFLLENIESDGEEEDDGDSENKEDKGDSENSEGGDNELESDESDSEGEFGDIEIENIDLDISDTEKDFENYSVEIKVKDFLHSDLVDDLPCSIVDVDIKDCSYDLKIANDDRWQELKKVARKKASKNRPIGRSKNTGKRPRNSKIHKLSLRDDRIFGKKEKINYNDKPEFVILLDCSGSMVMRRHNNKTLLNLALSAGYQATNALKEGRIDVKLFGHSTDDQGGVVLYDLNGKEVYSKISTINHLSHRFCFNNGDSAAIEMASKQFTRGDRKRILIVVSDGKPQCRLYEDGEDGINRTKESVDAVRRNGVEVVSLSITPEADETNDRIYGEDRNVSADNPQDLVELINKYI